MSDVCVVATVVVSGVRREEHHLSWCTPTGAAEYTTSWVSKAYSCFFVHPFSIISVFVVYSFAVLLFLCLGVLLCCMGGALRRLFVVNVCLYLGLIDRNGVKTTISHRRSEQPHR